MQGTLLKVKKHQDLGLMAKARDLLLMYPAMQKGLAFSALLNHFH